MSNTIKGKLVQGLGEGAYYIGIYQAKLFDCVGFKSFLGTLNVECLSDINDFLQDMQSCTIDSFEHDGKNFGAVVCYNVKVNNINAALIQPLLAKHRRQVVEIIAEDNLRSKLGLNDGDIITVSKK